jgi:hypothetical protein
MNINEKLIGNLVVRSGGDPTERAGQRVGSGRRDSFYSNPKCYLFNHCCRYEG